MVGWRRKTAAEQRDKRWLQRCMLTYMNVWKAVRLMKRRTRLSLRPNEIEMVKLVYNATPHLETHAEILVFLRSLGQSMSDSELGELLDDTCYKSGTHMTLERVMRIMETLKQRHYDSIVPDTVEAFAALGGRKDKMGGVDVDILRGAVQAFELTIDIDAMIHEVDTDASGFIEYEEFSAMFDTSDPSDRRRSLGQGEAWGRKMLRSSIPSFSQLLPAAVGARSTRGGSRVSAASLKGGKALGLEKIESKLDNTKSEMREGRARDAPMSHLSEMAHLRDRLRDVTATDREPFLGDGHHAYRADALLASEANKPMDAWARRQVLSRSVAYIGNDPAPQRAGIRYASPAASYTINHKSKVHNISSPREAPQLWCAQRAATPNPIVRTQYQHAVHTKLLRSNRLCPATQTSSKVVDDAPEADIRAAERFGAKRRNVPRVAAQRLMADRRYIDYLASTPSFVPSASEVHMLKSKYRAPAEHLRAIGVTSKSAVRLASIAQIALTGMSSPQACANPDLLEDPHLRAAGFATAQNCRRSPADTLTVRCASR